MTDEEAMAQHHQFLDEIAAKVRACYDRIIGHVTAVARVNGYAIATHGSLRRDIDLVAIPWIENAVSPEALVEELQSLINAIEIDHDPESFAMLKKDVAPTVKPHGRIAVSIYLPYTYIDLSVMPRLVPTPSE